MFLTGFPAFFLIFFLRKKRMDENLQKSVSHRMFLQRIRRQTSREGKSGTRKQRKTENRDGRWKMMHENMIHKTFREVEICAYDEKTLFGWKHF